MSAHWAPNLDLDYDLYNRLVDRLVSIAVRLRSPDPVQAAQAALDAAWQNDFARDGLLLYFVNSNSNQLGEESSRKISLVQLIAWLRTAIWREAYRQRTRERSVAFSQIEPFHGSAIEERISGAVNDPEGDLAARSYGQLLDNALTDCMQRLKSRQRRVFELRREGKAYEEIAVVLGVPRNTVATWLHRACNDLKNCLRRKGVLDAAP